MAGVDVSSRGDLVEREPGLLAELDARAPEARAPETRAAAARAVELQAHIRLGPGALAHRTAS